jgi:hypothetical protein
MFGQMKSVLACTILLAGCSAYRISAIDNEAIRTAPADTAARVEVTKTSSGLEGFQCYEPLLYGLTLGVIPVNCVDTYAVSVTSSAGDTVRGNYRFSVWAGWASVLLAPLPDWHWQMGYAHDVDPAAKIKDHLRDSSR